MPLNKIVTIFILNSLVHSNSLAVKVAFDLKGLYASVFTPVDENGNLALEVILQYVQYITDNNIPGVLIAGNAGEGTTLSVAEELKLITAWVDVAKPRNINVIVQIGGRPLPDVISLAEYAEKAGVDAILTLPDLFYKPVTPEELVFFMRTIARAAPNTPLLYYDVPSVTGVYVDMVQFTLQATQRIPTFKGLAIDDCDNSLRVQPILQEGQRIFIVNASYLVPAVFLGIDSFILGEINFFPDLVKAVVENGRKGNLSATRMLYEELVDLSGTITSVGKPVPASKSALPLITGINAGPARAPEIPLSKNQQIQLMNKLKDKGLRIIYSNT